MSASSKAQTTCRLTDMTAGTSARLLTTETVRESDQQELDMLIALGLAPDRSFQLCKAGNPCIVQVGATRIGISESVAQHLQVAIEQQSTGS